MFRKRALSAPSATRGLKYAITVAVGLGLVSLAVAAGSWSPAGLSSDFLSTITGLLGSFSCLYFALRAPSEARRSWALFAAVLFLYAAGDVLWLTFGGAAGTPAVLSFADALYLLALVPAVLGLALYPVVDRRRATLGPLLFDAALLGAAALLVGFVLVFDEVIRLTGDFWDTFIYLVYPITDVLLACWALLLLLRSVGKPRPDLVLIGSCFATYAAADTGYALYTARGVDTLGTVVDLAYTVAPLLLGLAAFAAGTRQRSPRTLQRQLSGVLPPLIPDLGALAALALFVTLHHESGSISWILAWITLGLTGIRQLTLTSDRHRVRDDLEERIAARDDDFRRLSEAHLQLETMKYEFVSAVSHELRTPLTAIHGALEILADGDAGELPERAQAVVDMANRGTGRLARLVDDIIDLERLERGVFSFTPRPEPLAPLLADAVAPLSTLAQERGLTLTLTPISEVALCDGDRVIQALVNLIGNALKFTPTGGTITVSTAVSDDLVVVSVADQGRGIPADELDSIFERFHQVEAGDDRSHTGAGLGLTITKYIVEGQGGRIWAVSTMGVGSTFSFTLPHIATDAGPRVPCAAGPTQAPEPISTAARSSPRRA